MNVRVITIALLLATLPVGAQKKKTVVNDSNTPLHLLQPAYQGTYCLLYTSPSPRDRG
mgnify:CR=1 FL=1